MVAYIVTSLVSLAAGFTIRHFLQHRLMPLTKEASLVISEMLNHLDGIPNKSERIIRNDAALLRIYLANKLR